MHILQSGEINGAKGLSSNLFDRLLMLLIKLAAQAKTDAWEEASGFWWSGAKNRSAESYRE